MAFSWSDLSTDYADLTWSGDKKYTMTENDDDTVSFTDETEYTNEDESAFGAADVNNITSRLNSLGAAMTDVDDRVMGEGRGIHNSIYRGKYLGTEITDDQWTEIENGTFNDLYIGDYWTINGVNWRIAEFNRYYNCGDTACTTHHVVIIPDSCILTSQTMNSSNTTSGGYVGSAMYTDVLPEALEIVESAFGSAHILTHRQYLTNTITSGYPSAGSWYDSQIELMNEIAVYGTHIYAPANYLGSTIPNNYTIDKTQIALFRYRPDLIGIRTAWWLRDVVSAAYFALVGYGGNANYTNAGNAGGVRPAFSIC